MKVKDTLALLPAGYKINPKSKKGLLILGLLVTGHKLSESRSTSKYLAFEREDKEYLLFVGKSAALRRGRIASQSSSLERSKTYQAFLTLGERLESLNSQEAAQNTFARLIGSPAVKS